MRPGQRRLPGRLAAAAVALLLGVAPPLCAGTTEGGERSDGSEARLIEVLNEIQANRLDTALKGVEALVEENPRFKLAQLVYGDLLLAMAEPIQGIGGGIGGLFDGSRRDDLKDLVEEAKMRWERHQAPPPQSLVPENLLQLSPDQHHAMVVDLTRSRLYVYENGPDGLKLKEDYYVTYGKNGAHKLKQGDKRTPVGVYYVTGRIPSEQLSDLYGAGAYPVNYPNEWDQRTGRTGYGIWLHGNPSDTYSRPPRASDGCVTLSNRDFQTVEGNIDVGFTPVVITDDLHWSDPQRLGERSKQLGALVEKWRRDWESSNVQRYLSHYSKEFFSQGWDYRRWSQHKLHAGKGEEPTAVELSDLSMFLYPGEQEMMVVNFRQKYTASNLTREAMKRQYWRRESDGVWRIVYEGPA